MGIRVNGCGTHEKATQVMFLNNQYCEICKSNQDFYLYEVKKRITVFFVPLVNLQKKHGVFCSICERGIFIDEADANKILSGEIVL